jgi:hypothetical protein
VNPADYDQHLPEILALANRVADDLEHVTSLPASEIVRSRPQHIDESETDPGRRNYVSWFTYGDSWDDEWQAAAVGAVKWLRSELPRVAETNVGTEGIDDDDDEDFESFRQAVPLRVQSILNQPFVIDAPGVTSFWRPEDIELATYGNPLYRITAASLLFAAWKEFVTRHEATKLAGLLKGVQNHMDRPAYGRSADDLPEAPQRDALNNLTTAIVNRDKASAQLARAENTVADRVRAAIDADVPVTRIAAALDVTRARVYQIRDGRR